MSTGSFGPHRCQSLLYSHVLAVGRWVSWVLTSQLPGDQRTPKCTLSKAPEGRGKAATYSAGPPHLPCYPHHTSSGLIPLGLHGSGPSTFRRWRKEKGVAGTRMAPHQQTTTCGPLFIRTHLTHLWIFYGYFQAIGLQLGSCNWDHMCCKSTIFTT